MFKAQVRMDLPPRAVLVASITCERQRDTEARTRMRDGASRCQQPEDVQPRVVREEEMQEAQGRCCHEDPENPSAKVDGGEPGRNKDRASLSSCGISPVPRRGGRKAALDAPCPCSCLEGACKHIHPQGFRQPQPHPTPVSAASPIPVPTLCPGLWQG